MNKRLVSYAVIVTTLLAGVFGGSCTSSIEQTTSGKVIQMAICQNVNVIHRLDTNQQESKMKQAGE